MGNQIIAKDRISAEGLGFGSGMGFGVDMCINFKVSDSMSKLNFFDFIKQSKEKL